MKYRNIAVGEVIPENAELLYKSDRKFLPYWNKDYPYKKGIINYIFDLSDLRVPIEEDN